MPYNSWKLMDKIDVAVRDGNDKREYFNGYVVEHGDEDALKKAKSWAEIRNYNREKQAYDEPTPPKVYTFENKGFTVKILDSAGGSSQGGRLSFWKCEVEKDGIKFIVGVNDAILADLIRNSDISNGVVKQKVMFARQSGQPGFIHGGMEAYKEAVADMQKKADMKAAKKTSKWEMGGIYSTLTQADVCLGKVFDTMEEYKEQDSQYSSWYSRHTTKLRKRAEPVEVYAWIRVSSYRHKDEIRSFTDFLNEELDSGYIYFSTGKPPARVKSAQLEVKNSDLELIDKLLAKKEDYTESYGGDKIIGRFRRLK